MLAKKMAKEKASSEFSKRLIEKQAKEEAQILKMEADHERKMDMIK